LRAPLSLIPDRFWQEAYKTEKVMNKLRYFVAFLVLASYPPAIMLWVVIHPFASFWRRLGPVWTYVVLGVPAAGYVAVAWMARGFLLGTDLGTSAITLVLAAVFFVAGALLGRAWRKHLTFAMLSGVPELSRQRYPGKLLTEGIYGQVRHPRYVEVVLVTFSYAFFANYLGVYLMVLLSLPLLFLVVLLEERELRRRFGADYDEYCRRVPRFVPKREPRIGDDA
jgi:protein-S-isoprenylcysteine O-methyltransferase Ste14